MLVRFGTDEKEDDDNIRWQECDDCGWGFEGVVETWKSNSNFFHFKVFFIFLTAMRSKHPFLVYLGLGFSFICDFLFSAAPIPPLLFLFLFLTLFSVTAVKVNQ